MARRSIMVSQPAKLSCEHHTLAIKQQQTVHIPFEDIAVIILDHREIVLTHPVLTTCAQLGIALFSRGRIIFPMAFSCLFYNIAAKASLSICNKT